MRCDAFLDALDRHADRDLPAQAPWLDHARTCPSCALALRLERSLRDAPSWTPTPALSPERRARVLAEAKLRALHIPSPLQLLGESAVSALVVLSIMGAAAYALTGKAAGLLPDVAHGWFRPVLAPLEGALRGLVAAADPLLQSPSLVVLLAMTTFAVCLAAIFSARVVSMRHPT